MPQFDRVMRVLFLTFALAFGSCGGEPDPSRPPPGAEGTATGASASGESSPPASDVEPAATTVVPSGPAPELAFVLTSEIDGVGISIANHGRSAASLRTALEVEIETSGAFTSTEEHAALAIRADCVTEPEACVTLAPGGELLPPHWLGTWGDAQCRCTRCGPVTPGRYRLVVTSCDGQHRVESTPITLPIR